MKRIILFIITFSILISSAIPVYADNISTGSAIKSIKSVSDIKAAGDTVAPVSSTGNMYYFNGTSISYISKTISTWSGLAEGITQAFANSISSLSSQLKSAISSQTTSLNSGLTNIENAVDDVWNRLGIILSSVDQIEGYIDGIEGGITTVYSYLGDIKLYVDGLETKLDTSNNNTSNIYSILSNGLDIDLGSPYQPYFLPSDNYDFNTNDWDYYYIRTVDEWGTVSSTSFTNTNILMGLKRLLVNLNNNNTYGFRNIANGVGGTNNSNFVPKLYNKDLTTTNASKISVWKSILEYGENTSMFLSRLAFVLASDDEISARQAASDNQDAFVNDFLDSNGSGSASASDIGDMSGISSGVQDILSTGVSPTSAFSSMSSDSSAWDWFKNDTKNALDTTSSNRRNIRSSDSNTPLLNNYYSDLQEKLKVYKK